MLNRIVGLTFKHLKNMMDPYRKLVNLKLFKSTKIYIKKLKKYTNLYQNAVKKKQ